MIEESRPKYRQIYTTIKDKISSGFYKPGDKLPSENELSTLFSVSRITSKRALQELEAVGMIYRKKGQGSFVNQALNSKKKTGKILLVLPYAADENWGNYLAGITPLSSRNSYSVVTEDISTFASHNTNEIQENFDGLIYYTTQLSKDVDWLIQLKLQHFPIVLLDQTFSGLPINSVVVDNLKGGNLATEALVAAGHTNIAFVSSKRATNSLSSSVGKRYFGYISALCTNNIQKTTNIIGADSLVLNSYETVIKQLLADDNTAVVAENDVVALSLMDTAKKMGLKIPEDLSIVGFDNIPAAATSEPGLTTINQDFKKIGEEAIKSLLALLKNPLNPETKTTFIPVKLVKRDSILDIRGKKK